MKFHEVPNPAFGKKNPMQQYRLQSNLSESSFEGKENNNKVKGNNSLDIMSKDAACKLEEIIVPL